jgi:hypothetical protein
MARPPVSRASLRTLSTVLGQVFLEKWTEKITQKQGSLCPSVTEQFLAFFSEKTAGDRDGVIAFLEDEPARDKTSSPLILFRPALAAISGNVFLGNAVHDRANPRPHAGTGAHGAGLVCGVEHEVGQVTAIAA